MRQPGYLLRPVAFRPSLSTGLALSYVGTFQYTINQDRSQYDCVLGGTVTVLPISVQGGGIVPQPILSEKTNNPACTQLVGGPTQIL